MKRSRGAAAGGSDAVDLEKKVSDLIKSKGSMGIHPPEIAAALGVPQPTITKVLKTLDTKSLVKLVYGHKSRTRKIYMSVEFEPAPEISGGVWYKDGQLDVTFIDDLRKVCIMLIQRDKVVTVEDVTASINRHNLVTGGADMRCIKDILTSLLLDRIIEEVRSTGKGEFVGVPAGKSCFRMLSAAPDSSGGGGGALLSIPCGVCPRIGECTPDGLISPSTCVYYQKWLGIDY